MMNRPWAGAKSKVDRRRCGCGGASTGCRRCARQRRGAAFTPLQGVSSKGHGKLNMQGCCQGEGIHPGRAMEREEIAAAGWLERKRRERRAPTRCGCTEAVACMTKQRRRRYGRVGGEILNRLSRVAPAAGRLSRRQRHGEKGSEVRRSHGVIDSSKPPISVPLWLREKSFFSF